MTGPLASPVSAETGEAFQSAFVRSERAWHPVQPNDERVRAGVLPSQDEASWYRQGSTAADPTAMATMIETTDLHPTSRNRRIVALNRSNNIGTVIPSDMTTIRERVIPGSESRKPRGRV